MSAAPVSHPIADTIERFRAGFHALGIAENDIKVTWDSEKGWARLRMRLASGAIVEKVDHVAAGESVEAPLWRLAQYVHAGVSKVHPRAKKGQPKAAPVTVDVAFADSIKTPAVTP